LFQIDCCVEIEEPTVLNAIEKVLSRAALDPRLQDRLFYIKEDEREGISDMLAETHGKGAGELFPIIYIKLDQFKKLDPSVMVGIIAHEVAHVALHSDKEKTGLKEEQEADQKARDWGFADEIQVMRKLIGEATSNNRFE